MSTRLSTLILAFSALALCGFGLCSWPVSAQAPHKASKPKMRPMGLLHSGNHYGLQINGVEVAQFKEVAGLKSENDIAEYRNGESGSNHPMKIPGTKIGAITLKRGVVSGGSQLNSWINDVRSEGKPKHREITIVLYNEKDQPVQVFKLKNAKPKRWKGPKLNAKGNDTAMEELVLSTENIEIVPPSK